MKKILLIMLTISLGLVVNAQVQSKSFANDTIVSDTNTYVSNLLIDGYSNTVLLFAFTKSDVKDSLSTAKIQGSVDNSVFVDLVDASANLTNTSTNGTTILYVTNPKMFYYRGFLSCASGDTVAVTNASFYIKKEE